MGIFEGTVDFDTSSGTSELTSAGASDAFLLRLGQGGDDQLGDPNGDGFINSTDALWIIQSEFGVRPGLTNETSDLNGDSSINSTDALWVIQIEFGLRPPP